MMEFTKEMTIFLVLFWSAIEMAHTYTQSDLHFFEEFLSQSGYRSNNYNFIICKKSESINVIKMVSGRLQRFVSFQNGDKFRCAYENEITTYIINLKCPKWSKILLRAEQLDLFRKPYEWYLFGDHFDRNASITKYDTSRGPGEGLLPPHAALWTFLNTLPILVDSDFKVVLRDGRGKLFVTSPYKVSRERDLIREHLAEWTEENGLLVLNSKGVFPRRRNMQGIVIPGSIVFTDESSVNHTEDLVKSHIDTTSKLVHEILHYMQPLANVSISYRIENVWGTQLKNGSWTGMTGDLERKEVEIGAVLFLNKKKLNIVEYYATVTPSRATFIFISPPLSHSSNIFTMPFSTMVWMSGLVIFSIACLLLFVAINFEKVQNKIHERDTNEKIRESQQRISLSDIILYNIGAICLQGTAAETYKPAGRIITLFLYLSYMFLYISYSAAIVAILQSSDTSIQSLFDLLKSPMKVGADDIAYSQYYFRISNDSFRKEFYRRKMQPKNGKSHFLPPQEGIENVRKGLYAFHIETAVGYQIIQKTFTESEKCGLQELKTSFFDVGDPWLVMKKYSPYSEIFKMGLKRIIEVGLKSRSVARYYTTKPKCGSKSSRFVNVGLVDCYPAFKILVCGTVLGWIVLLAELIVEKCHQNLKISQRGKNTFPTA